MQSLWKDEKFMSGDSRRTFQLDNRRLSVLVHSLFSSWMLAFLFEGQIFYSLADANKIDPTVMVFCGVAAIFAGLLLCGLFIQTKKAAKRLFLCSYLFFIAVSVIFFFPPSVFWAAGIIVGSFLAGGCVAAWAFYLKSGTPKNERIKTVADMLILSNVLMILCNMAAIHLSPQAGLALAMLMLLGAFVLALKLPADDNAVSSTSTEQRENPVGIARLLLFLCLFIVIITINSGLMYEVVNPAFVHLEGLTSWYWAVPYIVALFVMRNLSRRMNRAYILYVATAMIGLSFIGFMGLDRGAASYFVVNTLMLGACGCLICFGGASSARC
jgi:MFS family permease